MKKNTKSNRRFPNTTDDKSVYVERWHEHINQLHTLAFNPDHAAGEQVRESIEDLIELVEVIAFAKFDKPDKTAIPSAAAVIHEEARQARLRERIKASLARWDKARRDLDDACLPVGIEDGDCDNHASIKGI